CGATNELQFDHVIPVALGGGSSADNLQLLCGPCNRRKGAGLTSGYPSTTTQQAAAAPRIPPSTPPPSNEPWWKQQGLGSPWLPFDMVGGARASATHDHQATETSASPGLDHMAVPSDARFAIGQFALRQSLVAGVVLDPG